MTPGVPVAELDARFGEPDVAPTSWADAEALLRTAEVSWISTVRADGRPHVTPLPTVWHDGAVWFCTGEAEQKARNLDRSDRCAVTTGTNRMNEGLDVVVEGRATRVAEEDTLRRVAAAYFDKYGDQWRYEVVDGAFLHTGGRAVVFRLVPDKVLAFGKAPFSQTRWRFASP